MVAEAGMERTVDELRWSGGVEYGWVALNQDEGVAESRLGVAEKGEGILKVKGDTEDWCVCSWNGIVMTK